jgi:subtilisin family serine protease
VRVLDKTGSGEESAVNAGIRWAAAHGAKVINVSIGGNVPLVGNVPGASADTDKAVAYAFSKGAVVVASAGNSTVPLCDYPAAASDAVCVGATDRNGNPSAYSNFPVSPNGTVAVRAPGGAGSLLFCEDDGDIWSTMWPKSDDDNCGGTIDGYDTLAGTSMSAPFVSGVAALLSGRGLNAPQILQCLKAHSSNGGGYDPVNGYGIVDAAAAVGACSPRTPPFHGRHHVIVTLVKKTRRQIAQDGRVKVTVKSDTAVKVKLRAIVRRDGRSTTGARRTVTLRQAGKRTVALKLGDKARSALAKKGAKLRVTYAGGGESGVAKTS